MEKNHRLISRHVGRLMGECILRQVYFDFAHTHARIEKQGKRWAEWKIKKQRDREKMEIKEYKQTKDVTAPTTIMEMQPLYYTNATKVTIRPLVSPQWLYGFPSR